MDNNDKVEKMQNSCRIEVSDYSGKVTIDINSSEATVVPKQAMLVTPPCKYFPFLPSWERKYSFHFNRPELGKCVVGQKIQTMPRNITKRTKTYLNKF